MRHSLDFLSTTTRNIEERHRSMRAVFDQSWKLLAEDERLIFAKLSVFVGGFDANAAVQVADASFACMAALVEKSLVQVEAADRFDIHEMLRQYGMERLEAYGEREAAYARHSAHFAQLMLRHESALKQPQQLETMQVIERDFENIRLAWEWSAKNQQVATLHTLLNGLYLYGLLRSRYRETITIFQETLEQPIADVSLRGRLLARRWGYLHWWYQTDYEEALASIKQALTIAVAENNSFEIAFCHLMSAYVMTSTQRYAEAPPHLEISQALFEAVNEPYYVCWVLHRLGYVYINLNEVNKGVEYTEQSLALARVSHNGFSLVICLHNLASVFILNGAYIKGRHYAQEALHFATETGHQGQVAHVLSSLALVAFCQGDYDACREYAERSRKSAEEFNQFVIQPYSLSLQILLACLREDYAEGMRLTELGKYVSTYTMGSQLMAWAKAALACGLGRPAEARVYIQKVLELFDPDVIPATIIWMTPCVAYTLAETEPEKAVQLLAWVLAYPDTTLNWVRQWPLFERLLAQLQARMDADTYQAHWDAGEALTFDRLKVIIQHAFRALSDETAHQHLLTVRENEILRLLAAGMTNPQIAARLVIGAGTVKTHTLNIYRKLDVANRTQAIVRAQELGLLRA
ncbi:MAG: hypothetical protein H7175_02385 [Burkholderiales bacterium]|nr:hypothetical protein [Anaerolineae bacterium]